MLRCVALKPSSSKMSEIIQINSPSGRVYKTPEGNIYPSVTRVVGILNEKHIREWRERVGEEEANRVSAWASGHGTRFHTLMEDTLTKGKQTIPFGKEFFVVYPKLCREVVPNIGKIHGIELPMYSDTLKVAGTCDLLAEYKGELAVIDWKTSRHKKSIKDVTSYWCQTASYAVMAKERLGLDVKRLVLVINEGDRDVEVFECRPEQWIERFKKVREVFFKKYGM